MNYINIDNKTGLHNTSKKHTIKFLHKKQESIIHIFI
jgi:hypothetical protein